MPHEWLATPIRTFFAMFREGQKNQARQYSELARISLISNNMKIDYYVETQARYEAVFNPEVTKRPEGGKKGYVLDAGSDDAMKAMRSVAQGLKRGLGYGRR